VFWSLNPDDVAWRRPELVCELDLLLIGQGGRLRRNLLKVPLSGCLLPATPSSAEEKEQKRKKMVRIVHFVRKSHARVKGSWS
jgi:hypothetical protein